jgi:hypothetical protein
MTSTFYFPAGARGPMLAGLAALTLIGCERADPQFRADLARGVSTVMCAESLEEREHGVVQLAHSIDRFKPQSPYENRKIAVDQALEELAKSGCPGRA